MTSILFYLIMVTGEMVCDPYIHSLFLLPKILIYECMKQENFFFVIFFFTLGNLVSFSL